MNKGQLTALNVGGAQVERVVLHDALSSGLAARYVVIEAECGGPRHSFTPKRDHRSDVRFRDQAIPESGEMSVVRSV